MNEWFKKVLDQIKSLWSKWTKLQKVILVSIVGAVILGIVLLVTFSRSPSMVSLLSTPITDTELLDKISLRLDEEKVDHTVTADGRILVADKKTAQRMVAVLMREDLLPKDISPWDVFKMDSWSVTDFERDVNLRQAITKNLEQHIMALEDVDAAKVTLVIPE